MHMAMHTHMRILTQHLSHTPHKVVHEGVVLVLGLLNHFIPSSPRQVCRQWTVAVVQDPRPKLRLRTT